MHNSNSSCDERSTNAVLHLIAMSRSVQDPDVYFGLDDFQRISDCTPFLADLKPSGKYVMEDIQGIGGTPGLIKFMIDEGVTKPSEERSDELATR